MARVISTEKKKIVINLELDEIELNTIVCGLACLSDTDLAEMAHKKCLAISSNSFALYSTLDDLAIKIKKGEL